MNDAENLTKLLGHLPPAVFRAFMVDEFGLVMPELDAKKLKKEQREPMEAALSALGVSERQQIEDVAERIVLLSDGAGQDVIDGFKDDTTFFLPWADDPNTEARLALGVSHVSTAHIDQLVDDFQKVLRKSLLFLRHVRTAELRRNGKLLLACDLERGDGSDLIVSFRPSGEVEQWHILRADAAESAARLYASHPRLESLERSR